MRKFHVEYTRKSSVWDSISACTPRRNRVYETRFLRVLHVKIESMRLGFLKVKPSLRQSIFTLSEFTRLGLSLLGAENIWPARHWSCLLGAENIWPARHWSCLLCFILNVQSYIKKKSLGVQNIWPAMHWSCHAHFYVYFECAKSEQHCFGIGHICVLFFGWLVRKKKTLTQLSHLQQLLSQNLSQQLSQNIIQLS